jgi:hypothetical protein
MRRSRGMMEEPGQVRYNGRDGRRERYDGRSWTAIVPEPTGLVGEVMLPFSECCLLLV